MSGFTSGSLGGQFTHPNAGNEDTFLLKLGIGGPLFWARLLGTSGEDDGRAVAVDNSNHVYVTGFTAGNLDGQTNVGGFDACLIGAGGTARRAHTQTQGPVLPTPTPFLFFLSQNLF